MAIGLMVAMVSACAAPSDDDAAARHPLPTKSFDAKNPATWTLPVEAYLPTDEEGKEIARAKGALVSDCMKDFGFDWTPAPELPKVGPKSLTEWRYGIHDGDLAKRRGYKPEAAEEAAYEAALSKGVKDGASPGGPEAKTLTGEIVNVAGKKVPDGGCIGQANRKVLGDASQFSETAQRISTEAFVKSKSDKRVVEAFAAWSSCMKESGYSYAEPLDASDDRRFSSREVTGLEISTATADIACRKRTEVANVWFAAETELQEQAIEEKAEQLDEDRKSLDAAVKNAAHVLSGSR